jgi:hypothetical protein
MAEMLRDDLRAHRLPGGRGGADLRAPGRLGLPTTRARSRTLAVYMMYDVQPVEAEDWRVDPFAGELVDHALGRVLMARGATNQKGPQRAFLNAVEAIIRTEGRLPVNLMIARRRRGGARLAALPGADRPLRRPAPHRRRRPLPDERPGPRRLRRHDARASRASSTSRWRRRGGEQHGGPREAEIHSSLKAMVDSPVWRLTQAIASLTSPDGNTILVPGYYDAIRPPNEEEQRLVNGMLEEWTSASRHAPRPRRRRWIDGLSGSESLMQYLFNTSSTSTASGAATRGPAPRRSCRTRRPPSWTRAWCPTRRRRSRCG